MKIISVVGARPNFMKIAPIYKAFLKFNRENPEARITHLICHTGQHYDEKMSKVFFEDLELPKPDFYLGIGSASHAVQTAEIMIKFEQILLSENPDLIIVVGDVNSTIACSLTAAKMNVKIAHIEAGLRSFDRAMPEEINRILTDHISDYLFVTEESGLINLENEGIPKGKVFFTGNVMIDNIVRYMPKIDASPILEQITAKFNLNFSGGYILMTLHRPSNVDDPEFLKQLIENLKDLSQKAGIIFPIHPRTKKNLERLGIKNSIPDNVVLCEPLGYIDFMYLVKNAKVILTDSGGIQEESTFLGVPCVTLRDNTERPVTVNKGTNILAGSDISKASRIVLEVINGRCKTGEIPAFWDGESSTRIISVIQNFL